MRHTSQHTSPTRQRGSSEKSRRLVFFGASGAGHGGVRRPAPSVLRPAPSIFSQENRAEHFETLAATLQHTSPTRQRGSSENSRRLVFFGASGADHGGVRRPAPSVLPRAGLTLLELMLALALSTVVLGLIALSMNLYLRMLESRRSDIEQAQLARAILQRMTDDLRRAMQPQPQEMSALQELIKIGQSRQSNRASSSQQDTGQADVGDAEPSETGSTEGQSDSDEFSSTETEEESPATTLIPTDVPGLYGNQYQLQVDISRLPRVEEYQREVPEDFLATLVDIPSDIKTVAYYLQAAGSLTTGAAGSMAAEATEAGLVRRELDRRVTLWANENGTIEPLLRRGELMAPEVVLLEFRYFDGMDWLTEWDSQVSGGLPLAIEIAIGLLEPAELDEPTAAVEPVLYRTIVRLPLATISGSTATTTAGGEML